MLFPIPSIRTAAGKSRRELSFSVSKAKRKRHKEKSCRHLCADGLRSGQRSFFLFFFSLLVLLFLLMSEVSTPHRSQRVDEQFWKYESLRPEAASSLPHLPETSFAVLLPLLDDTAGCWIRRSHFKIASYDSITVTRSLGWWRWRCWAMIIIPIARITITSSSAPHQRVT